MNRKASSNVIVLSDNCRAYETERCRAVAIGAFKRHGNYNNFVKHSEPGHEFCLTFNTILSVAEKTERYEDMITTPIVGNAHDDGLLMCLATQIACDEDETHVRRIDAVRVLDLCIGNRQESYSMVDVYEFVMELIETGCAERIDGVLRLF